MPRVLLWSCRAFAVACALVACVIGVALIRLERSFDDGGPAIVAVAGWVVAGSVLAFAGWLWTFGAATVRRAFDD